MEFRDEFVNGIEAVLLLIVFDVPVAEISDVLDELFALADEFFLGAAFEVLANVVPETLKELYLL